MENKGGGPALGAVSLVELEGNRHFVISYAILGTAPPMASVKIILKCPRNLAMKWCFGPWEVEGSLTGKQQL
jgi:hypothetical protein